MSGRYKKDNYYYYHYFTPWHTCSFRQKFGFSEKHSAMLQLLCEAFIHESPAFYHIVLADMLFADFIL